MKKVADACTGAHRDTGVQGGGKVATVQIDVSDKTQVSNVLSKIPADLKSIDVLGAHDIRYPLQNSLCEPFHSE